MDRYVYTYILRHIYALIKSAVEAEECYDLLMHLDIDGHIHMDTYEYMYMYIYIHIHTHTHAHIPAYSEGSYGGGVLRRAMYVSICGCI